MPVLNSNFKIVTFWLLSIILVAVLQSGCASNKKYPPLERARAAYGDAASIPDVRTNAPVAFHEAGKALEKAEIVKDMEEKRHFSYLAEKNAEIAVAIAEQKKAEKEIERLKWEEETAILSARRAEASVSKAQVAREEAEAKAREAQEAIARAERIESELTAMNALKTDRGMVLTLGDVLFATGKAELASGTRQTLDNLAAFLDKYPECNVQVEGHTDSTGSAELNLDLSERRAQSVKIALLERGISFDRINAVGYGKDRPIAPNDTAAGRQQNRRVEIVILNKGESS
ncbi:MAG: OmpA family protein [Desulfobacteraceae bacterium]|nr:MAG: OmpA family protein [Desulfobacteraceae bacterium]